MAYSFENIQRAMTNPYWGAPPLNTSGEDSPEDGRQQVVVQVIQIIQECIKLNTLAQRYRHLRPLSPNMTAMMNWCDSNTDKWFGQYYYTRWLNSSLKRNYDKINYYLHPILIGLSIVTTVLALGILWRIESRQKRAAWYFLFTINNCILLTVLLETLPRYAAKRFRTMDIYLTLIGCKLLTFLANVFQHAPTWILTVALIDQVSALRRARNPSRATSASTQITRLPTLSLFAAKATVICILVGLGVINVHTLWLYNLKATVQKGGGGSRGEEVDYPDVNATHYNLSLLNQTTPELGPRRGPPTSRTKCILIPSADPSPGAGVFIYGYPIFLLVMHSVVPQLALLAVFAVDLFGCCTGSSVSYTGNEPGLIRACAALQLFCDLPATTSWFYFHYAPAERTYQVFKLYYSINFTILIWTYLKFVVFVPIIAVGSPLFRREAWHLIRHTSAAAARRLMAACRRRAVLDCACTGRQLQCVCECTRPKCHKRPVRMCARDCICLRCQWPELNSFEYTRGYLREQPGPAHASIEATEEEEGDNSPSVATTAHLALPMLCECACFRFNEGEEEKRPSKRRVKEGAWDKAEAAELMPAGKERASGEQGAMLGACGSESC